MFKNLLRNKQVIYILLIFLMVIGMALMTMFNFDFGIFSYEVGDVARNDIVLEVDIKDDQETALERQVAVDRIQPIEYIDITLQINVRKDLEYFFDTLNETKNFHENDAEILKNVYFGIERNNKYTLDESELKHLAVIDEDRLNVFKNTVMDTTSEFMSSGISEQTIQSKKSDVVTFIDSLNDFNETEKSMAKKIINHSLVVNQFVDTDKTNQAKQNAFNEVEDVVIKSGTVLVTQGSYITADALRIMKNASMLVENQNAFNGIVAIVFVMVIFWMLLGLYLIYQFAEKNVYNLFINQVIFTLIYVVNILLPESLHGLMLIPLLSILLTLIGNPMVGFIYGLIMIILMAVVQSLSGMLIVMYLGSIIIVALSVNKYSQRRQLMVSGAMIAGFNAIFITAYYVLQGNGFIEFYDVVLVVSLNGILGSIFALGILPVIEILFKVLTPIKLMELTNPNQPLLKRLLVEAPGTYHHSIIVGNLAETAAHAIDCDYLLARVGAHYHDIGKLQRPYYFKENQLGDENIHDQLEPVISAGVIKSHVDHGVHLATKNKLPKEIIDIIKEHHGTTIIKYFYHKAIESAKSDESIGVSKFTYDGPTPLSKESAIVMLADSVEAAVRSLSDHSDESILKMVKAVFKQKMDDGQLSHCNLTLNDIEKIQIAFIKVLSGIFHDRVQYPKDEE